MDSVGKIVGEAAGKIDKESKPYVIKIKQSEEAIKKIAAKYGQQAGEAAAKKVDAVRVSQSISKNMLKDMKEGYSKDSEQTDIKLKKDQEIHFGDNPTIDE